MNVYPATPAPAPTFDFTKRSNALQADQVIDSACQFCNCNFRLKVHLKAGRVTVRGTALLWEGIREDTIFVPNTFGPMQKVAEEFGDPLYEPANLLTDDRYFDNLSGQQAYKCFACRVKKVS